MPGCLGALDMQHRHCFVGHLLFISFTRCAVHLHSLHSFAFISTIITLSFQMKHSAAYILALTSLSNASPVPQFSIPSFSDIGFPSFPKPTGGFSLGGFSLPSLPSSPAATQTPGSGGGLPTNIQATTTAVAQATTTGTTGGGAVGSDCASQGDGGGSTENGVADKNCCTDLTVVFARGTSEQGNVGTVSGPPMFKSLRAKLGVDRVTVQGVDYPASASVSHPMPSLDEDGR